jgi:DNA-binding MarR family transcriptional regulator
MSKAPSADVDRVWQALVAIVMDGLGDWRRKVADATGLPFTRVRVLRRLDSGPLTMSELAEASSSDAPATTVAVNDLERRGLVLRSPRPDDRRVKMVSLTAAGRRTLATANRVKQPAPEPFASLADQDVVALSCIIDRLARP